MLTKARILKIIVLDKEYLSSITQHTFSCHKLDQKTQLAQDLHTFVLSIGGSVVEEICTFDQTKEDV